MILDHRGDIIYKSAGVDAAQPLCHRCGNRNRRYFYTYYADFHETRVMYCMKCVSLGRSDSIAPLKCKATERKAEPTPYGLDFELSGQQSHASERILETVKKGGSLLLYAVTGAGKTEMTFESIGWARGEGLNVAFVSPRIDVVKEVHMRLCGAFRSSGIDLMYDGVKQVSNHHFTVCTVHQLYNFIDHFDCIIVDETDAFPLPQDPLLMHAIRRAATGQASFIFMTATPSRQLVREVGDENIITLPRRYHGHDLAVPKMVWHNVARDVGRRRLPKKLMALIRNILEEKRRVLIFIPEIAMMEALFTLVKAHFPASASVHSGDPDRGGKVERMRMGEIEVMLTTTILERGVTFDRLDAIIIHAERFNAESLIQMCGRVGRKPTDPVGRIWFIAHHQSSGIRRTIRTIRDLNQRTVVG
ncbi:helicase-related protein [Salinicoccus luteus]|uniref:helicase-related protein n=1 Tax=Salinicoccus luteus TaxID=367840 RepID=UPI00055D4C36|nr:helicase-related protein [Salinicoccus luteus]